MREELGVITVKVKLFASLREIAGTGNMQLELEDKTTVGGLRKRISEIYPAISKIRFPIAVAINGRIARDSETLNQMDEIALLPPVSGGG